MVLQQIEYGKIIKCKNVRKIKIHSKKKNILDTIVVAILTIMKLMVKIIIVPKIVTIITKIIMIIYIYTYRHRILRPCYSAWARP